MSVPGIWVLVFLLHKFSLPLFFRVFADRFTTFNDQNWFTAEIEKISLQELGNDYKEMIKPSPVFVDFMRDAPEPTGEEGEETDMELPKVYEPVTDIEQLRERLKMFLVQFNEMVSNFPI
jgi:dynein heavy chain